MTLNLGNIHLSSILHLTRCSATCVRTCDLVNDTRRRPDGNFSAIADVEIQDVATAPYPPHVCHGRLKRAGEGGS
jgi:hypothetical protein